MRGDLGNIDIQKQNLKYLGNEEVSSNWKDLSPEEIKKLGLPQIPAGHMEGSKMAADGAFQDLDLRQFGYKRQGEKDQEVQVSVQETVQNQQRENQNASEVQGWLAGLKNKALMNQ